MIQEEKATWQKKNYEQQERHVPVRLHSPFMAVFGCQRQIVQTYHCLIENSERRELRTQNPTCVHCWNAQY
jgi:hypothetical protein